MYHLINVPLDGTAESEHALPWALAIARTGGSAIELVHVAGPHSHGAELYPATVRDDDPQARRALAERRMQRLADEVARADGVPVSSVVLSGDEPVTTLLEHLTRRHADLVVMTSHRHGRLAELVLGNVSEMLVRKAGIPVLVTHPRPGIPELSLAPVIEHLMVPLDGSEFSQRILPHACELASLFEARLTLLTVAPAGVAATATAQRQDGVEDQRSGQSQGSADRRLDREGLEHIAAGLRREGFPVDTELLIDDRPASAIADYADHHAVDVIAMTTHGWTAVTRVFAGSVAGDVLRHAAAALLVLRPID